MSKSLFDGDIPPKCKYCKFGIDTSDGTKVLCPKKGILDPDFSCGKYQYDALKRTPQRHAKQQEFSAEDFSLS